MERKVRKRTVWISICTQYFSHFVYSQSTKTPIKVSAYYFVATAYVCIHMRSRFTFLTTISCDYNSKKKPQYLSRSFNNKNPHKRYYCLNYCCNKLVHFSQYCNMNIYLQRDWKMAKIKVQNKLLAVHRRKTTASLASFFEYL